MKLSEYVAQFLSDLNAGSLTRVYGVCGGGAMHLNDAICHHPGIKFTAHHHEQAASFAAEADARVSNQIGIVHVTAGPGVTNVVTGVACAWADSIPMLVIAGQVESRTLKGSSGVRQLGISEVDGPAILGPITKYAVCVTDPRSIRYHLECAVFHVKHGRPGPAYIETPLDVQAAQIEPEQLAGFYPPLYPSTKDYLQERAAYCVRLLNQAQRPVIIAGNGIRLAGAEAEFDRLKEFGIPILTSWNASDLIDSRDVHYVGRPGLIGDRAGNFAVQNADVVLAIGTRLSIPQTGHHPELFAPNAVRIIVDIDYDEIYKWDQRGAHVISVCADAKEFLVELLKHKAPSYRPSWVERCNEWKAKYPVILPEYRETKDGVNSYFFVETLAKHLNEDAIVVTDVGTAFVGTMQAMPLRGTQRLMHSSGIAPMGWGLPAAIGASMAAPGRQVVCICGDGGIMFNLQELQTIAHHKLPIAIFVLCNGGYLTMRLTQRTHFKRLSVASPKSGVSFPDFVNVAKAFEIGFNESFTQDGITYWFKHGFPVHIPSVHMIHMPPDQVLQPRVQSKMNPDGSFTPSPIEDLWPHLRQEEMDENMGRTRTKEDAA